jgi:histidinol-phosphate aminotransferase
MVSLHPFLQQLKTSMKFDLQALVRPNIWALKPYSSARNEFTGAADVYLDANENPYPNGLNRYPDPLAMHVNRRISDIKGIASEQIFLGSGSDEAIDLVFRIFCNAGDNVITVPPTYGMYEVSANISDISIQKIPLLLDFQLDTDAIIHALNEKTKIIFLCTPNNPTGNDVKITDIEHILTAFKGIVVVDEAYIDFSRNPSCIGLLEKHPNLVVFQTFSKAWGKAAMRLGMAFSSKPIIALFNKTKPPYNISSLTQKAALHVLENGYETMQKRVKIILQSREKLSKMLASLPIVQEIYPSDANFILVKVIDADKIYAYLTQKGIVVRNRNTTILCENCLRITVGTAIENKKLITALESYKLCELRVEI